VTSARHFKLWPKFPAAREAILLVMIHLKEATFRSKVKEIVESERNLLFQGSEIKQRLKDYR
jgi:hypothetical protein